jgi:hypothetical protein
MSEITADIVGTKGANFTLRISSAMIVNARLIVPNGPDIGLTVDGANREVSVPNLPAGDSVVSLALVWAPGDFDAVIDVGKVTSGTVNPANPRHTIDAGDTPAFVELFGK